MPGKAAKVRLSEKQLAMLTDIAKSRSLPQFLTQRANIVRREHQYSRAARV